MRLALRALCAITLLTLLSSFSRGGEPALPAITTAIVLAEARPDAAPAPGSMTVELHDLWQSLRVIPAPLAAAQAIDHDAVPAAALPENLYSIRLSRQLLQDFMGQDISRDHDVDDEILNTIITGKAHTAGKLTLELLPCDDGAWGEVHFSGVIHSVTDGVNGAVVLHNKAVTTFDLRKQLVIDDMGLRLEPISASAVTKSETTSIDCKISGFLGQSAKRVAEQRAAELRPQADLIAAEHALARIEQEFIERVGALGDPQRAAIGALLSVAGNVTEGVQPWVRSTADYIEIIGRRDAAANRGDDPPQLPPKLGGNPHVGVLIHRAALDQAASNSRWLASLLSAGRLGPQTGAGGLASPLAVNSPLWSWRWSPDGSWLFVEYQSAPPAPTVRGVEF